MEYDKIQKLDGYQGDYLSTDSYIPSNSSRKYCNILETVLNFARSALKLVVLDSHKTYHI